MKNYTTKPVPVQAEQYTGTKASIDSVKKAFGINHDHVIFDDKGKVLEWRIGNHPRDLKLVSLNSFFVIDSQKNISILNPDTFAASFDLVPGQK